MRNLPAGPGFMSFGSGRSRGQFHLNARASMKYRSPCTWEEPVSQYTSRVLMRHRRMEAVEAGASMQLMTQGYTGVSAATA